MCAIFRELWKLKYSWLCITKMSSIEGIWIVREEFSELIIKENSLQLCYQKKGEKMIEVEVIQYTDFCDINFCLWLFNRQGHPTLQSSLSARTTTSSSAIRSTRRNTGPSWSAPSLIGSSTLPIHRMQGSLMWLRAWRWAVLQALSPTMSTC